MILLRLILETDPRSPAVWRFFKAGALGSYDPQIIKPPAVLLFGMRGVVLSSEFIDEGMGTLAPRLGIRNDVQTERSHFIDVVTCCNQVSLTVFRFPHRSWCHKFESILSEEARAIRTTRRDFMLMQVS